MKTKNDHLPNYDNFFLWLSKNIPNKSQISKTKVVNLPIFGNSLLTTQKIKKNEIILEIPQHLFLSMENALNDEIIQNLILKKNLYFDKKTIFALYLLIQLNKGKESFWSPYLQILPQNYTNLVTWSKEEMGILKRKGLVDFCSEKIRIVENEFEKIQRLLEENKEMKQLSSLKRLINLEKFVEMFALVESRTLYYKNEGDRDSSIGTLVPYYDFCNHSFLKDVNAFEHFFYDSNKRSYILKAYKNFEENEQVFICYGNYNNIHFLEFYGFLPFDNISNNYIQISVNFQLERIFKTQLKRIIQGFERKTQIIQKIFPQFCKKGKTSKKQKTELETNLNIQIESCNGNPAKFTWEIESLLFILSLEEEKLGSDIEVVVFNELDEAIQNDSFLKCMFQNLKTHLLEEFSENENMQEIIKKRENPENISPRETLARQYYMYEQSLVGSLNY